MLKKTVHCYIISIDADLLHIAVTGISQKLDTEASLPHAVFPSHSEVPPNPTTKCTFLLQMLQMAQAEEIGTSREK